MGTEGNLTPISNEPEKRGLRLIKDIQAGLDPIDILNNEEQINTLEALETSIGSPAIYHEQMMYALVEIKELNLFDFGVKKSHLARDKNLSPVIFTIKWSSDEPRYAGPMVNKDGEKAYSGIAPNKYAQNYLGSGGVYNDKWDLLFDSERAALLETCIASLPNHCGWIAISDKLKECELDLYNWVDELQWVRKRLTRIS